MSDYITYTYSYGNVASGYGDLTSSTASSTAIHNHYYRNDPIYTVFFNEPIVDNNYFSPYVISNISNITITKEEETDFNRTEELDEFLDSFPII